jgi:hypothetical protein
MNASVEAQLKSILAQEKLAKLDEKLQVIQTAESIKSERDESLSAEELKKGLLNKTGDGANANIVKMLAEIKKTNTILKKQNDPKAVLDKVGERREFKTIGQRVTGVKENVKDFFSMRGFLDKTGIVKRGSGGIFGEALDAREDRQKYAKNRIQAGDPTVHLHGKEGARKIFERQRGEQQQLVRDTNKNDAKLKEYKDLNVSDRQIGLSPEMKAKEGLAERWQKSDPSTRIKPDNSALADENNMSESEIEQAKISEEQTDVLNKIEENTRPSDQDVKPKEEAKAGGGLLDGIMGSLGSGLMSAFKFLFSPANLLKAFTKVFVPAMIIGSLVNGIMDGFKTFAETGSISEALIAGLGGVLSFLSFGLFDAETIKGLVDSVSGFIDEYIITPIKNLFGSIKDSILGVFGLGGDDKESKAKPNKTAITNAPPSVKTTEQVSGTLKGVTGDQIKSHPNFKKYLAEEESNFPGSSENYASAADRVKEDMVKEQSAKVKAVTPSMGNKVYGESAKVDAANKQPAAAQKQSTVISAPTQVNNSTQNATFKTPVRNQDNTVNSYLKSRYVA